MNFWNKLKEEAQKTGKPFFALAPMADVTDVAFRQVITKYGKPDVLWTEFVSADGLMSEGREVLKKSLEFTEAERPIVAQIFSSNPEKIRGAAKLCAELGFDGIDINMGCPDKSIERQGAGAAMINNKQNAILIIQAVKDGIADANKNIPISVKTRIGYSRPELDEWVSLILAQNIDCLTVHARTRRDLSKVPANWNYIKQVVEIKNKIAPNTVIIGNGDVIDTNDGISKFKQTGCDGIMIGRAIFGNPWLFSQNENGSERAKRVEGSFSKIFEKIRLLYLKITGNKNKYWLRTKTNIPLEQKLNVMLEHAYLFEKLLTGYKNFAVMKKHFKAYSNGFPGAKELRIKLMDQAGSAIEAEKIVKDFFTKN